MTANPNKRFVIEQYLSPREEARIRDLIVQERQSQDDFSAKQENLTDAEIGAYLKEMLEFSLETFIWDGVP